MVESSALVALVVMFCCGAVCFGCIIVFRCGFVMRVFCHIEFSSFSRMVLQAPK